MLFTNSLKLKEKIKSSDRMFIPLLAYKCIKYSEYKDLIKDVYDGNAMVARTYGDKNIGRVIYYVNISNPTTGLFYFWKHAVYATSICEEYGMCPVINVSDSPYHEKKYGENSFEYYFEPLSDVKLEDVFCSRMVITRALTTNMKISQFKNLFGYSNYNEDIEKCAYYTSKYIKIKPEILKMIDTDFSAFKFDKMLAVHIRGVEWGNLNRHPIPIELNEYFNKIDTAIEKYKFEYIFIATDSEETLQKCKDRYLDKMVTFNDVARTKAGSYKLVIVDEKIISENSPFRLGYEVLRDMLALSRCSGLIAGFSNVSFAAQSFKLARGEKYFYKYIIQNEIQTHGQNHL